MTGLDRYYRNFFEKASIRLEKLSNGAIDTKVLKEVGSAGRAVGKFIGSVPGVRRGPVDEFLQEGGARLTGMASGLEKKVVREFAVLGNPNTSVITGRIQDMIQIFNHTEGICFDHENIYLISESN